MVNLMDASRQWASRPNDERFWGLHDLREELSRQTDVSQEVNTDVRTMQVVARGEDLCLQGERGKPAPLSNWAFGQLSGNVGAPANYLRELPINLAVQNLNYGLKKIVDKDTYNTKLLLHRTGAENWTVRAMTSQSYGRIWNLDLANKLTPALETGWMVPPARPATDNDPRTRKATATDIIPGQDDFGLSVKIGDDIAPAGVYCGDRDMFVFLVNPKRIINDGNSGLMRGVYIWNSEVGAGSFKVKTFFLENVCGNHICWGASNIQEIKIVHRKNSIIGFDKAAMLSLGHYANQACTADEAMIVAARKKELGKSEKEVVDKLFGMKSVGLAKRDIEAGFRAAVRWEHTAKSAPTTVWGMVHGLTRYSQISKYADARNVIDIAAGKLLALAL